MPSASLLPVVLALLLAAASVEAAPAASSKSADADENLATAGAGPARDVFSWNQSQNGKFNLQVSLKDVQIVALLNSDMYDDDDNNAEYDYADLEALLNSTVSAQRPTPSEEEDPEDSTSSDEEPLLTVAEVLEAAANQSANSAEDPEAKGMQNSTLLKPNPSLFVANGKPENISQLPNDPAKKAIRPEVYKRQPPSSTPSPRCEEGFAKDRLGRCRRVRTATKRRRPNVLTFPLKLSLQGLAKGFRLARLPSDDDWE